MPSTVKVRIKGARNLFHSSSAVNASSPPQRPIIGSSFVSVTLGVGSHTGLVSNDEELESLAGEGWNYQSEGSGGLQIAASPSSVAVNNKRAYSARTKLKRTPFVWNEEFRFEVANDKLLQEEPLIFKVWVANANGLEGSLQGGSTSLGLVYVDLNPLLRTSNTSDDEDQRGLVLDSIDGYFPLYDTLSGVRGELGLSIKINFIGDVNPFRDSSAGVQLFPFPLLDKNSGLNVVHVFGFVEELVVADDPEFEYQGTSSVLQYRQASRTVQNETRQSLMYLLDSSVRRRMCKKVLEMGGNAVLNYYQNFDMEVTSDSKMLLCYLGVCMSYLTFRCVDNYMYIYIYIS